MFIWMVTHLYFYLSFQRAFYKLIAVQATPLCSEPPYLKILRDLFSIVCSLDIYCLLVHIMVRACPRSVRDLAFSSISEETFILELTFSAFAVPHKTTIA